MIFTTVGTHIAPFDRLVSRMDEIAGLTTEPVFIQIGTATVTPLKAKHSRFFPERDYQDLLSECRVVVSHAGVGTILRASLLMKPIVCVPRLRRYREHWDNHQLEICRQLSRNGELCFLEDTQKLDLQTLESATPPVLSETGQRLADRILSFLNEVHPQNRSVR